MKLLALTVTLAVGASAPALAAPQTLLLDAVPSHVQGGHATGPLRDARGRAVGRFAFACRSIGAGREHCSGWGKTADGRLRFAGAARRADATHHWTIAAAGGAYEGARGTLDVRDLDGGEALITVTIAPRAGVVLRSAVVRRAPANGPFRTRADARCASAAAKLAALPPFPFTNFDPLHPNPALLPQVGQFFTGPHDPRPALRALGEQLRALGAPPAGRGAWARVLAARAASLGVTTRQDDAALAANAPAFVRSVHDAARTFRAVAISASVFAVSRCVI
jgi:hypothetical protein